MLQITKLILKGEKKFVGKVGFFKGEDGVESVKHLYLIEHKSSQELCIIMINISFILRLDTETSSYAELIKGKAKCPVT